METGVFFNEQTVQDITTAVQTFKKNQDHFVPSKISEHAQKFNTKRFENEFSGYVNNKLNLINKTPLERK